MRKFNNYLFSIQEQQQIENFLYHNFYSQISSKKAINWIKKQLAENNYVELWPNPTGVSSSGAVRLSIKITRYNHFGYTKPSVDITLKEVKPDGKMFYPPISFSFSPKSLFSKNFIESKLQNSLTFKKFILLVNSDPHGLYDQYSNKKIKF